MHDGSAEDIEWAEMPWSSTESEYATRLRLPPTDGHRRHMKLIKVHSEDTGETMRPCVAKSYSFGGYGGVSVLNRGDSVMSTHSAGPRLLTKQDSAASSVSWRLSPSSSGYKSQSQMSESVTPSPTSTPHPTTDDCQKHLLDNHIVWAVTDIHNVPKGSIIINPQVIRFFGLLTSYYFDFLRLFRLGSRLRTTTVHCIITIRIIHRLALFKRNNHR